MNTVAPAQDDLISPTDLADQLRTTKKELGETLGVPPESLSRRERVRSKSTQTALRHLIEVLNAMEPVVGNRIMAFAWFRSEPLVGFGGRTPEEVVKDGEFEGLRIHIRRRLAGGYA